MACIDGFLLPVENVEELKRISRDIPDTQVLFYCKGDQDLMKGLSGRQQGVRLLRSRLIAHLESKLELKSRIRSLLARHSLNQEFAVVLSPEALEAALVSFLGYFGKTPFLTALLLDEREEVRSLALEFLKEEQSLPEREPALALLREQFAPFLQHAAPCFDGAPHVFSAATPAAGDVGRKEDQDLILSLTEENNRLKRESDKESDYCKSRLKKAGEEKEHLSERVEELRRERDRLKENLVKTKKSLAKMEQTFDERLASKLEKEFQERLVILNGRVEQERSRLREMLLEPPAGKAFHEALKAVVEAVTSPDDLIPLRDRFEGLSLAGFLTDKELEELDLICTSRFDKLMTDYSIPGKPPFEDGDSELARALRGKAQLELLLDGHNILHCLSDIFSRYYENGAPGKKARDHLAALLKNRIVSAPTLRVLLFFDGTRDYTENPRNNFSIFYSGEREHEPGFDIFADDPGKHKADRAILRYLKDCKNMDLPRFLVTDDQDLRKQAERHGARHLSVVDFGEFLSIRK
jgi:hypothetical protein